MRDMDPAVAEWFDKTNNPKAEVMLAVRAIVLEDPDITETIKYRAPAFEDGSLMCYFNWSAKKQATLVFPKGRWLPGELPSMRDGSNQQRMMDFVDLDDVERKADDLRHAIATHLAST